MGSGLEKGAFQLVIRGSSSIAAGPSLCGSLVSNNNNNNMFHSRTAFFSNLLPGSLPVLHRLGRVLRCEWFGTTTLPSHSRVNMKYGAAWGWVGEWEKDDRG
eukprot:gene6963-4929_t